MRQVSGCCTAVFSLHFASEDSLCHLSGLPLGTFFSLCHTRTYTHPVEENGHFFRSRRQLYLHLSLTHTHTRTVREFLVIFTLTFGWMIKKATIYFKLP